MICVERGDASAGRGSVRAATAAGGGAFTRANDGTAAGVPVGFGVGGERGATGGGGLAFGASRGATTGAGIGAFSGDGAGAGDGRRPMTGGAWVGLGGTRVAARAAATGATGAELCGADGRCVMGGIVCSGVVRGLGAAGGGGTAAGFGEAGCGAGTGAVGTGGEAAATVGFGVADACSLVTAVGDGDETVGTCAGGVASLTGVCGATDVAEVGALEGPSGDAAGAAPRGLETSCFVTDSAESVAPVEDSVVVDGALTALAGVTRRRIIFAGVGAEPASASARISAAVLRLRGVFGRSVSSMSEV